MDAIASLTREVRKLWRAVRKLQIGTAARHYRGTSAADFTTTTLPHEGDYGFQTTDNELQMNCNGTIRAVAMAAL